MHQLLGGRNEHAESRCGLDRRKHPEVVWCIHSADACIQLHAACELGVLVALGPSMFQLLVE